jgi:hypothetical protein
LDILTKPLGAVDRRHLVLAMFAPWHIANWSKFPAWYHLTFLLTIIRAVLVGALLPRRRNKDLNEVSCEPR